MTGTLKLVPIFDIEPGSPAIFFHEGNPYTCYLQTYLSEFNFKGEKYTGWVIDGIGSLGSNFRPTEELKQLAITTPGSPHSGISKKGTGPGVNKRFIRDNQYLVIKENVELGLKHLNEEVEFDYVSTKNSPQKVKLKTKKTLPYPNERNEIQNEMFKRHDHKMIDDKSIIVYSEEDVFFLLELMRTKALKISGFNKTNMPKELEIYIETL